LHSYLQRKVRQAEQAEDLAQETFYRALKAAQTETCRLPTTFPEYRSWLYRIATNLAIDTLRRGRCLTWCDLDAAYTIAAAGPGADPQEMYLHWEEAHRVRTALARLPEHYRRVLVLYYQGELTIAEMARRIGISPAASKMLLVRARSAFARQYQEQHEEVSA
ncbi:MAG TPA: RNA polymerase sigma factor, partial [Ktedonobacteraceae bacterium]